MSGWFCRVRKWLAVSSVGLKQMYFQFGMVSLFLRERVSRFTAYTLHETESLRKLYIGEALLGFIFGVVIGMHHFSLLSARHPQNPA